MNAAGSKRKVCRFHRALAISKGLNTQASKPIYYGVTMTSTPKVHGKAVDYTVQALCGSGSRIAYSVQDGHEHVTCKRCLSIIAGFAAKDGWTQAELIKLNFDRTAARSFLQERWGIK